MPSTFARIALALALVPACVPAASNGDIEDPANANLGPKSDSYAEGSAAAAAILALVNDPMTDVERLDIDAGLSSRAANNIISMRGMGYMSIAQLDAVPYVGPVTMDALYAFAKAEGYEMNGSTDATLSITWGLHTVGGGQAMCPAGYDTLVLHSQRLTSQGASTGAPIVDLYDCAAGMGSASLAPGRYRVWTEVTSYNALMQYASSTSAIVDLSMADATVSFSILTDGGYFSLDWTLQGAQSQQSLQCSDVPGVAGVELAATVANSLQLITDIWNCDDYTGITAGLAAGSYTLSLSALDMGNLSLGTAPALSGEIQPRNKVTNLGMITIPIDGR